MSISQLTAIAPKSTSKRYVMTSAERLMHLKPRLRHVECSSARLLTKKKRRTPGSSNARQSSGKSESSKLRASVKR